MNLRHRVRDLLGAAASAVVMAAGGAVAAPPTVLPPVTRVHVPAGRFAEIDVGPGRYVPMPLAEFERALLSAGATGGPAAAGPPRGMVDATRMRVRVGADGRVGGTLAFDVSDPAQRGGAVPLGHLHVGTATCETADGTGPAVVHARRDGLTAVAIPTAGTYRCEWTVPSFSAGQQARGIPPVLCLPLVPALRTTIVLEVPAGVRPVGGGVAWRGGDASSATADSGTTVVWTADCPPLREIGIHLRTAPPGDERRIWSTHVLGVRDTRSETVVEPIGPWLDSNQTLTVDDAMTIVAVEVRAAGGGRQGLPWRRQAGGIDVDVPAALQGTRTPLVVVGIAPAVGPGSGAVPMVNVPAPSWSGGGIRLSLDPELALTGLVNGACVPVTAAVAARWPWPPGGDGDGAMIHLAAEGPFATVRVTLQRRGPVLDVARVTSVDVAAARLLGVTTCDVRVERGEAFALVGRIGPDWIIDAVETFAPADASDSSPADALVGRSLPAVEPVEWRVAEDPGGAVLRIGLATAATRSRPLGVRITGHRPGAAFGSALPVREAEMLVVDGERDGAAALALRAAPDTTLEIAPSPAVPLVPAPRLAALAGEGPIRLWLPAGNALPAAAVSLVERRPPIGVHARIGVSVRDDRLAESFTLECRPGDAPLDAIVVRFSEPIEAPLEWVLLPPAAGSVAARPLEPAGPGGAETAWLVEFVPPARETVSIRAHRVATIDGATAVPLVRVDGAVDLVGDVVVRTAGRRRPTVVNHRLGELPPGPTPRGAADDVIAEFHYTMADAEVGGGEGPALEIVPDAGGGDRDARAWVWSEVVESWCHRSGRTEMESRFEIENHGRSALSLVPPAGKRLQGVLLDGRRLVVDADAVGGAVTIDLPPDRRRLTLTVRSVTDDAADGGPWAVDSAAGAVDLPVLERSWRLWLPPGVDVALGPPHHRLVAAPTLDWCQRLFGFAAPGTAEPFDGESLEPSGTLVGGCRERLYVPLPGHPGADVVWLVGRSDVDRAALLAATFLAGCLVFASGWRPGLLVMVPLVAGLTALWVPAPWHVPARAVAWATLGVGATAWWRRFRHDRGRRAMLLAACLALAASSAHAAEGELPPRVFITPIGGVPMALVPEGLFERLGGNGDEAGPRVLAATIELPEPGAGPAWRVTIDVDADAGTSLLLPFPGPDGERSGRVTIDGRAADWLPAGALGARVPIAEAGRHRIEWQVEPLLLRRGDVAVAMVALPPAPKATLVAAGGNTAWLAEVAAPGRPFGPAPMLPGVAERDPPRYDVAGGDRVAVLTSLKPGALPAVAPRSARSRNDVEWGATACRVTSRFEIDAAEAVVPAVIVTADPRLVPVPGADDEVEIESLGSGRFRLVRRRPTAGDYRIAAEWTMPLDEPSGVFTVPGVWLDGAQADDRSVRLVAAPGLRATIQPTGNAAVPRPTSIGGELSWRVEGALGDTPLATTVSTVSRPPPASATRILVSRTPPVPRTSQQLRVALAPGRIETVLQARLESDMAIVTIPLVVPADVQLGTITVVDEAAAEAPREPLDIRVVGSAAARGDATPIEIVIQNPRSGRLRLDAEAILPGPVPVEGPLPVLRLADESDGAVVVSWVAADGVAAEVNGAEAASTGVVDVDGSGVAPSYRLVALPPPPLDAGRGGDVPGDVGAAPARSTIPSGPRLELVDTLVAIDARGRGWGITRLDLVTGEPLVRLSLPPGMQPFKVFVDGRAVADPKPVGTVATPLWEIRLFDVHWPRSIEVVFAGELGTAIEGGPLTVLQAPGVDGLAPRATLWTLAVPRGMAVRTAPPALIVDEAGALRVRSAAAARLEGDFARAIADAGSDEAGRLRDLLASRRRPPTVPFVDAAAFPVAGRTDVFGHGVVVLAPEGSSRVEVRMVRATDATVAARAWASAGLMAAALALTALLSRSRTG